MMRREFEALARARAILRAYEQEANDETRKGSLDELRREVLERVRDVLLGEEGS